MLATVARFVVALTDAAITKIDAARERRAQARTRDAATDIRRPHLWGEWLASRGEHCAYCSVDKTPANEFHLCPATGKARDR